MASKKEEITDKQRDVWLFIVKHVERYGYQPSLREMAESLGVDKRAIQFRLVQLVAKGLIETADGRDRAIGLKNVRFKAVYDREEDGNAPPG